MQKSIIQYLIALFLFSGLSACVNTASKNNPIDESFMSLAYVSMPHLKLHEVEPEDVKSILDSYRWEGISDIALINGVYMTGKDGSIITRWNESEWPEVFEGEDYLGRPIKEQALRNRLCSREVVDEVMYYFKKKGMKLWVSQKAAGWLTGGSLGVVLEDEKMTKDYAVRLEKFVRQLGFVGVDFDWEFPPNKIQAVGYRRLMKAVKEAGLKVSVCAIRPPKGMAYGDMCIPRKADENGPAGQYMAYDKIIGEQMVDYINVMQYLGYNPQTGQMDVEVKKAKMGEWENFYPEGFTAKQKVKFLCGIGYYSYLIPEYAKEGEKGGKNMSFLYETYGEEALNEKVINGHAVWSTTDVREIVKYAKKQGWNGVFTWLVTHDFNNDIPVEYSRQNALAEEVNHIWNGRKVNENQIQ